MQPGLLPGASRVSWCGSGGGGSREGAVPDAQEPCMQGAGAMGHRCIY